MRRGLALLQDGGACLELLLDAVLGVHVLNHRTQQRTQAGHALLHQALQAGQPALAWSQARHRPAGACWAHRPLMEPGCRLPRRAPSKTIAAGSGWLSLAAVACTAGLIGPWCNSANSQTRVGRSGQAHLRAGPGRARLPAGSSPAPAGLFAPTAWPGSGAATPPGAGAAAGTGVPGTVKCLLASRSLWGRWKSGQLSSFQLAQPVSRAMASLSCTARQAFSGVVRAPACAGGHHPALCARRSQAEGLQRTSKQGSVLMLAQLQGCKSSFAADHPRLTAAAKWAPSGGVLASSA